MRLNPKIQARYLFASLVAAVPAAATDWPQFGYDGTHSGSNTAETSITAANVALLIPLYAAPATLAATVDSAPVYKAGVMVNGTLKNLLFFLSNNGRVMAIDSATGTSVWSHTTTGKQPATASPAIDPNGQFVYSYGIDGKAHKYKIDDGTETTTGGWPQTITLKTTVEKGASGLTIANSGGTQYLVVVTDGYIGDGGNYQGHLVSINLTTGAQTVFNTLCSTLTTHLGTADCTSAQSGIWGRGGATFLPATGRVYIATGNGQYNANTGGHNWSD
ncbi:MAG: PQQ-binding-like beta-propeller repeat protein, partial [Dokdonella sp.]